MRLAILSRISRADRPVPMWMFLPAFAPVLLTACTTVSLSERTLDTLMASKATSLSRIEDRHTIHSSMLRTGLLTDNADFLTIRDLEFTPQGDVSFRYEFKGGATASVGSAIPITADGYYLTARHCIEHREPRTLITLVEHEGELRMVKARPRLVWMNSEEEAVDLALIHAPVTPFRPFTLGSSQPLRQGDAVASTGWSGALQLNPLGGPAAGHTLETETSRGDPNAISWRTVWHTCALHPGDSGGPLIDPEGKLIGVNGVVTVSMLGRILTRLGFDPTEDSPLPGYRAAAVTPDAAWLASLIERDRSRATAGHLKDRQWCRVEKQSEPHS